MAFLCIENTNDSFPHISLVPKPDKAAEVAELFEECTAVFLRQDPGSARVVYADKQSAEQADDEYGDASWYELEDRLAYLQARAPKGCVLNSDFTWARWRRLLDAFDWKCAYCTSTDELGQDHVIPISDGGQDLMDNILPSCKDCNRKKAHKLLSDWLRQCRVGTIARIEAGRAKFR